MGCGQRVGGGGECGFVSRQRGRLILQVGVGAPALYVYMPLMVGDFQGEGNVAWWWLMMVRWSCRNLQGSSRDPNAISRLPG